MPDRLRVDTEALIHAGWLLEVAVEPLIGIGDHADAAARAGSHRWLASALGEFSDEWGARRAALLSEIVALGDAARHLGMVFDQLDQGLGAAASRGFGGTFGSSTGMTGGMTRRGMAGRMGAASFGGWQSGFYSASWSADGGVAPINSLSDLETWTIDAHSGEIEGAATGIRNRGEAVRDGVDQLFAVTARLAAEMHSEAVTQLHESAARQILIAGTDSAEGLHAAAYALGSFGESIQGILYHLGGVFSHVEQLLVARAEAEDWLQRFDNALAYLADRTAMDHTGLLFGAYEERRIIIEADRHQAQVQLKATNEQMVEAESELRRLHNQFDEAGADAARTISAAFGDIVYHGSVNWRNPGELVGDLWTRASESDAAYAVRVIAGTASDGNPTPGRATANGLERLHETSAEINSAFLDVGQH